MLDWSKPGRKYVEMATEFGAGMGRKKDSVPVITRQDHPQEWRDWYAYYGWRRLPFQQELMRTRDEKTVPVLSPFDFDVEFVLARPAPEVPRENDDARLPPKTELSRALHYAKYPQFRPMAERQTDQRENLLAGE